MKHKLIKTQQVTVISEHLLQTFFRVIHVTPSHQSKCYQAAIRRWGNWGSVTAPRQTCNACALWVSSSSPRLVCTLEVRARTSSADSTQQHISPLCFLPGKCGRSLSGGPGSGTVSLVLTPQPVHHTASVLGNVPPPLHRQASEW